MLTDDDRRKKNVHQIAWQKRNKDKVNAYHRRYRAKHAAKVHAWEQRYRDANRDRINAWHREARPRYRDHKLAYNRSEYSIRRALLDKIKLAYGCAICGYREHSCALDFDHVAPGKSFNVGSFGLMSFVRLIRELKKCRILCANCHRVHSFARK